MGSNSFMMRLLPLQIFFSILGILAPFFFPVPYVIILAVIIAIFVPPIAFLMGGLLDVLYFNGIGMPYFTIAGFILALLGVFVQQFVKTRIMS
jgi:hypothetical protein